MNSHAPILACLVLAGLLFAPATAQEPTEPDPPAEAEQPTEPAPPPMADLTPVNRMVETGAYEEAEAALAELQADFPDDPRLLLMRGELLLALQRFEESIPLLERTIELEPERVRSHFQLATAFQVTGNAEGALAAYAREIELNDDPRVEVMAHVNRSMLLEKARDWDGAAADLEAVLELDPENLEIYGELARLSMEAKQLERAAAYLERGLAAGFRSDQHFYILGAKFYEEKEYDEAITAFKKTLEINPKAGLAERSLAAAYDQIDQAERAVVHLRRYLELDPDAADADEVNRRIREVEGG